MFIQGGPITKIILSHTLIITIILVSTSVRKRVAAKFSIGRYV